MTLPEQQSSSMETPLLSVIVIGRNEGERLRRCLASVASMRKEDFEIEVIYVDSGSVDGSVDLAKDAGVQTLSLRPVRPSAALGRNAGWRAARGSYVLFLDGDTVLRPGFVADSLPAFRSAEIAVVWGHRRELFPQHSLYNRALDLDWIYRPGITEYCGGDALFRRSVLAQTGGFDETLIAGEEPELCRRIRELGFKILHVDRPMTGHDLAITHWAQYWRRAVRAGHAYAEVSARSRETSSPLWQDVSAGNQNRALSLIASAAIGFASAVALRSGWPILFLCILLALLTARTAWKARWKTGDILALALYGVHSHLQQLPIYLGQLQYKWNQTKGRSSELIEYKRQE